MRRLFPAALVAGVVGAGVLSMPPGDRGPAVTPPAAAKEKTASVEGVEPIRAVTRDVADVDVAAIDRAIDAGIAFLVKSQNKNGSWGSPAGNLYDIYAPVPGALDAFQAASSALAIIGLVESGAGRPEVDEAVRRGTTWLLANHAVRRGSVDTLYNTWAHAYSMEAFALLASRETDAARKEALRTEMLKALDMLRRYEFVDGGWGYYDFKARTQRPGPGATCFTTATALVAMAEAKEQGIEIPARLSDRAIRVLEMSRKPDNAFCYSLEHRFFPQGGINKVKGSLARTPACLYALQLWGKESTDAQVAKAFDDLIREDRFLRIARKYPVPHETWYQNSGYFCFYGYYYAARLLPRLPQESRVRGAKHVAGVLVPLQEKDGSFWDYQLYNFHKTYGTGYVLSTLAACRSVLAAK
jgi:hypothetical protein